ncbi:MAG: cytochrome c oxidase subunit 3 [Candidatus Thermoplasmatota archaeon]|nr:cytochrome c oxidase subunit 3 [Candidatus Thermoplasmatota archaeon]
MSGEHDYEHHIEPWGPHDWSHGAPHNSFAPLIMSIGFGVFLYTFANIFVMGELVDISSMAGVMLGFIIITLGLMIWWRQDMSFDGVYEPKGVGAPFRNIELRKVAMWIFLMSEMMVFTSLFSTYIRYRLGIQDCEELFLSGEWVEGTTVTCFEPAAHLIASSWFHLAPGAINTFALIISSFTIVLALKTAKMSNKKYAKKYNIDKADVEAHRSRKVGVFLGSTLFLATLFLTLKLIEWFIGFPTPGPLTELNHGYDSIKSLYAEGYTIHASAYTNVHYNADPTSKYFDIPADSALAMMMDAGTHPGGMMMADIRVSASTFYVTTGTHGVHVFAGMVGLSYMTFKALRGGYGPSNAVSIEYFGLYWHFVDLVWVLVFPFFYLF